MESRLVRIFISVVWYSENVLKLGEELSHYINLPKSPFLIFLFLSFFLSFFYLSCVLAFFLSCLHSFLLSFFLAFYLYCFIFGISLSLPPFLSFLLAVFFLRLFFLHLFLGFFSSACLSFLSFFFFPSFLSFLLTFFLSFWLVRELVCFCTAVYCSLRCSPLDGQINKSNSPLIWYSPCVSWSDLLH